MSSPDLSRTGHEVLPGSSVMLSRMVGGTEGLSRTSQSVVTAALTRTAATWREKGAL